MRFIRVPRWLGVSTHAYHSGKGVDMPVQIRLLLAILIFAVAGCWGVVLLAQDVHVGGSTCGSTLFTVQGMPGADVGGDGALTTRFADACVAEGRARVRWVAAPGALGLLALGYGAIQMRGKVRESRRRWDERNGPRPETQLH